METDSDHSVRSSPSKRVIGMIRLTIVSDVDGTARIENGENAGVGEASGVGGTVLDLETEMESVSAQACRVSSG